MRRICTCSERMFDADMQRSSHEGWEPGHKTSLHALALAPVCIQHGPPVGWWGGIRFARHAPRVAAAVAAAGAACRLSNSSNSSKSSSTWWVVGGGVVGGRVGQDRDTTWKQTLWWTLGNCTWLGRRGPQWQRQGQRQRHRGTGTGTGTGRHSITVRVQHCVHSSHTHARLPAAAIYYYLDRDGSPYSLSPLPAPPSAPSSSSSMSSSLSSSK